MEDAYCMRCKGKRLMREGVEVEMKNGRKAMKGVCAVCGTKVFRILGRSDRVFGTDSAG
jgi:hypothetical protein